ncbi:MAG: recombination mediator RecR [Cytophagales bacterium]
MNNYPSKLIEEAVNQFSKLPGVGKKSALRYVMHLLKKDEAYSVDLANAISELRLNTSYCKKCHNITENNKELCLICENPKREQQIVCVVEDIKDVLAIENTMQYRGLYHVLGGVISPIEGISPSDIRIEPLLERIENEKIKEVVLALSSTMEGDTTSFYITKKLKYSGVLVTTIARGIPVGGELEFTDEITLGRSIIKRVVYEV